MVDKLISFNEGRPRMGLPPVVEDRIVGHFSPNFVPKAIINLFDIEDTTLGTIAPNGDLVAHATNLTSDFIPVVGGQHYVSRHSRSSRIIWFTANKTVIAGTETGWLSSDVTHSWVAPDNAVFVRITMSVTSNDTDVTPIQFNQGTELVTGETISTGWWDDKELPPTTGQGAVDEGQVRALVESMLPQWEPSHPTLQFETIYTGADDPLWLSADGEMLYGRHGVTVVQSDDEWDTRQTVYDLPAYVNAIRTTNDGELLATTARNSDIGRKAAVYKSSGYTRENPTAATWTQVLEAGSAEANINNPWGMQVYHNIVILAEYGLRGEEGARRVWMSQDHGSTYTLVFDLKTVVADGAPAWGEGAHLHTPAWDPYWNRLWVVVGDGVHTATYFSDDYGTTWKFVEDSNAVQYTGIMPLPDAVIFGSDRNPNGVHIYRRGLKTDMPVIEPLLVIDDAESLTRVFMMPFKRDWSPTMPTYFAAQPSGASSPGSVIVATVDGRKAHLMWEGERPDTNGPLSGNIPSVFGPTVQGSLITAMTGDPAVTGTRVMKAPAPTWQRA